MLKHISLIALALCIAITSVPQVHAQDTVPPIQRLGTGVPTSIAASPDGKTLAVGSSIGVWLMDAVTLQPVGFIATGLWVDDVTYSADGQYLKIAARYYDQNSGLFDVTNAALLWLYDSDRYDLWNQSHSVQRRLRQTTLIYNFATDFLKSSIDSNSQVGWMEPACSVDQRLCARVGVSNFQIVNENTKVVTGFFDAPFSKDASISSDGKTLYGLSLGALSAWDLAGQTLVHENASLFTGTLVQVLWSPDGTQLASHSAIWDVQSAQIVSRRECYSSQPFDCKFYKMSAYHSVYRLDSATGNKLERFEPHCIYLQAAKLSSDSTLLATSGLDGRCAQSKVNGCTSDGWSTCIWQFDSFSLLAQIPARFIDFEFSPDNRLIIGKTAGGIEVWDWSSGTQVWSNPSDAGCHYWSMLPWRRFHDYERNRANETCIGIDPQGRYLATFANFSNSTDVHLWSINSGELIASFGGHTSEITSVAFSPDGAQLAASSLDGTVLVWAVP